MRLILIAIDLSSMFVQLEDYTLRRILSFTNSLPISLSLHHTSTCSESFPKVLLSVSFRAPPLPLLRASHSLISSLSFHRYSHFGSQIETASVLSVNSREPAQAWIDDVSYHHADKAQCSIGGFLCKGQSL